MAVVALRVPHRVFVAIQGGAALGAFPWGVLHGLLANPQTNIIGASGTSSGALTASFLIEGLTRGGRDLAARRLTDCWHGLSAFQKSEQSLWYHTAEAWHQVHSFNPFYQAFRAAAAAMLAHSTEPLLAYSPILRFLDIMDEKQQGLDFAALRRAGENLIVNAAYIPKGRNHWQVPPENERIFTGATLTREALAASGSLVGLTPSVVIGDEPLHDGAYCANPHVSKLAGLCVARSASLVILRTRPTGAFPFGPGLYPGTEDWSRAFFSAKLDDGLKKLRTDHPDLPVCIIEPSLAETHNPWQSIKPELSFDLRDLHRRYEDGYRAAQKAMENHPGIFGRSPLISVSTAAARAALG